MHPALMKEKHYATFFITIYCLPHFLSDPSENISTAGLGWARLGRGHAASPG